MDGTHLSPLTRMLMTSDRHHYSYCFDVFLGGNYNLSPPSVKYMTVKASFVFVKIITYHMIKRPVAEDIVSIRIYML